MAKLIAWLILIFVVLLALRVIALRKSRARQQAAGGTTAQAAAVPMVRCARCGVFLPRAEAQEAGGGYVCAAGGCAPHG
jgi:hypothetical protein